MNTIYYKDYKIVEKEYYNGNILYDIIYTLYDKNGRFLSNYYGTLENVKKDINDFWLKNYTC